METTPSQDPPYRFEGLIGREMKTKKKMRKKMITLTLLLCIL
jgi:hypothetical protein